MDISELQQALADMESGFSAKKDTVADVEEMHSEDFSATLDTSPDSVVVWPEREETSCCGHIKISSTGQVGAMYPHILGDYKHVDSSTYTKPGATPLYLTKPEA